MFLPLIKYPSKRTLGTFFWVNEIDQASKLINIQPLFVDDIVSLWIQKADHPEQLLAA